MLLQEPKPKKKNIDFNRKSLIESSLLTVIGVIFILIGTYVPFLSFLSLFTSVPVIITTYRNKMYYGLLSAVTTTVILGFFIHPITAFSALLVFLIPGVCIGFFMREKRPAFESIFYGFLAMTFTTVVFMQVLSLFLSIDILDSILAILRESINLQYEIIKEIPNVKKPNVEEILSSVKLFFPSIIIGSTLLMSFLNYYMSALIIRRTGDKNHVASITEFSMPGNISLGVLIIYLLTLVSGYFNYPYYETLVLNMAAIFILLFFLQGIAVIGYFFKHAKLNKSAKTIYILLLIVLLPVSSFISIIGFADAVFNFRRLKR